MFASENEYGNTLYKIELENTNYETVIIKIYTEKKYQLLPSPIKKDDYESVIFLPDTEKNLKLTPSITHLKDIIDKVKVEHFPLLSQKGGYTKIFITKSNKNVDLFIENHIYTKPQPKINQVVQKPQKEIIKKEVKKIIKEKPVKKEEPNIVETQTVRTKYIIKEVKTTVADYSAGTYTALALILLNLAFIYLNRKNKTEYDGKLTKVLNKKIKQISNEDYILLFSEDEPILINFYDYCRKNNVNLKIATKNVDNLSEKFDNPENIKFDLTEFKFDEFYKHREFYKNLSPKPAAYVFDIDSKIEISNNKFDFINLKKYIDTNYTNLFLLLNLIIEDLNKNESIIIFIDSNKKRSEQKISIDEQIQLSSQTAIKKFILNIKKLNTRKNKKIHYCFKNYKMTD